METESDNVALVRRLFELVARGDLAPMAELFHPDAELRPLSVEGRTYHGGGGAVECVTDATSCGKELVASAHRFRENGNCVVVFGALRQREGGSLAESSVVWLFRVEGGKVQQMDAYTDKRRALEAAGVAA